MGLSCGCDYDDYDGDGTAYYKPSNFIKMPWFDRRKRCLSCKSFISPNEQVAKFEGFRMPNCDYEINIKGRIFYVELAGMLGNVAHEECYRNNVPINSKSKEKYRLGLMKKKEIFEKRY